MARRRYPGRLGHPGAARVAVGLLNDHLRHCVSNAVGKTGADGDQLLAEVAGTIRQVVRL